MDDKLKVFWNLDVLVKMCRSKSDGPSLRIEEEEILEKIESCKQEIEELKALIEEESYDTSAEMADRNIEIITKKQLQTLKSTLKEKNKLLSALKDEEKTIYERNALLRENKQSQEKYIASMQERIGEATDYEVIDRYNGLIAETTEKVSKLVDDLEDQDLLYERIQENIIELSEEIAELEDKIDKKKKLLAETQANLENKENYIDKTKKEKNDKKISELELKVQKSTARLEEIRKDPKYLESKIKDVLNNKEDIENAIPYLIELINTVIKVPYINVPADNALEEELLKATQARDSFANEIEQKSYNILEANTPEKVRIEFLNERITLWHKELEELLAKVDVIDRDKEYGYEARNQTLYDMIQTMKKDLREFQRAYDEIPEINIGAKASIKAAIDEKKTDIVEAEKIATAFRKDESDDIERATRTVKYECDRLNKNIQQAEKEIEEIKNRLTSKKSGLIDISSKNKDKDTLKELAQTVISIKHRRQFPDTPLDIIKRLEAELDINLQKHIDYDFIDDTSEMIHKDYEEYKPTPEKTERKRGVKVVEETEVEPKIEDEEEVKNAEKLQQAEAELQSLINDIEAAEKKPAVSEEKNVEEIPVVKEVAPVVEEESTEDTENTEETTEDAEEDSAVEIVQQNESIEESTEFEKNLNELIDNPFQDEITVSDEPIVIEQPVEEPTVQEEMAPVVEEVSDEIIPEPVIIPDESEEEIQGPVVVEEVVSVVEEQTPVVEEAAPVVEESTPVIETQPVTEVTPVVEPTPVVEAQPVTEVAPIVEPTPVVEAQPVTEVAPIVEPTPAVEEVAPVVEEPFNENEIDEEIDSILSSTSIQNVMEEDDDDNQPLDIDAMFEKTESKPEQEKTTDNKSKKLSINSIFNVDDTETDSNDNLADDFEKYINDLGNKEA